MAERETVRDEHEVILILHTSQLPLVSYVLGSGRPPSFSFLADCTVVLAQIGLD